jgi:dihydrofolate reductase
MRCMHLVRYHLAISLDGFIAPKDGSAQWLEPYGKAAWAFLGPWMKNIGGIIVGRATYDQSASMGGWQWGDTPALVVTSRPLPPKHPKTVEASDDPSLGLARLRERMPPTKEGGGDIWLFGGGVTASGFLEAGLIDLIELAVVPVVLGEGRPLFPGVSTQLTFEPAGSQRIGAGAVVNTYRKIETPVRPKSTGKPAGRSTRRAKSR